MSTSLILIILTIGVLSCTNSGNSNKGAKHTGVEYFRSLQFSETPYDTEKGTHPLTPEEAKTINSYKFTYDNEGRLHSVEFVRNNVLLGYSSMGAAKIEYKYDNSMQTKYYYNKDNEQIESGGIYASQYALDSKGERVGLMYLSKDGSMIENRNKIHNWRWEKLPDGMIRELRYNLTGEEVVMNPFCPFYELRFSYNDKGYTVKMANYKADTLYNCTAENCGDVGVSYFSFTPNENGDVEKFEVFNVFGQMSNLYWGWSKRINKFDNNGYVTETLYYDQDNEVVGGKLVPLTKYSYDEHGALIETANCDKDGNKINSPDNGVAVTKFTYDEAGQRTGTSYFDKDNVEVKLP